MSMTIEAPSTKGKWNGRGAILRYPHAPRAITKAVTTGISRTELISILDEYSPSIGVDSSPPPIHCSDYKVYLMGCVKQNENLEDFTLVYIEIDETYTKLGRWSKYVIYNKKTHKFILRSGLQHPTYTGWLRDIGKLVISHDTNWLINPTNIWSNTLFWVNLKQRIRMWCVVNT
jgi:hypothetical protein